LYFRRRLHMETMMNRAIEEAIQLFRENETSFGDIKQDQEKANLYRGLAALAESIQELQRCVDQLNQNAGRQAIGAGPF
jgi:1-deoxy-D-xylulose 5-phosphate reductoisomerase